MPENSGLADGI